MGAPDKDRSIKRQALIFCVSQNLVPYLEVPVSETTQLGKDVELTTDIDVLGVSFEWTGRIRRTLFDCKSAKDSPINRSLWAAGLMSHLDLDDGYVILRRSAGATHKFSAEKRSVYLFDTASFDRFAGFYGSDINARQSYLADFGRQDEVIKFFNEKSALRRLYMEVAHRAPLQRDSGLGIRQLIAQLAEQKGELDPGKRAHIYIVCEAVAALSIYLFDFLSRVVRLIDASSTGDDYERIARMLLWGGREQYEEKKKIRQLAFPQFEENELQFPAWGEFIRMTSTLLLAVSDVSGVPLVMRNFSIRMAGEIKPESGRVHAKLV